MEIQLLQFEGWTTKSKVEIQKYVNQAHKTDPNVPEFYCTAFVTLMQKRGYEQIKKDSLGNIVYDVNKQPVKEPITDAITLKFRNAAAEAIARLKPEAVSRHLVVRATIATYDKVSTAVLQKQPNGKLVLTPIFIMANGVTSPMEHITKETIYEVSEFRFLDPGVQNNQPVAQVVPEGAVCGTNSPINATSPVTAQPAPSPVTAQPAPAKIQPVSAPVTEIGASVTNNVPMFNPDEFVAKDPAF